MKWLDRVVNYLFNYKSKDGVDGAITRYPAGPFYFKRDHFCYKCGGVLKRKEYYVIVNSNSKEAKNYNFSFADEYLTGNIKFITYYFECPDCGRMYEIREQINVEKELKKKRKS